MFSAATLRRLLRITWPGLVLAAVVLVAFASDLVLKHRTFYALLDNASEFFPWYQKLAVAVHHGTLPLWDANVSGGRSFVGELQAGVFYPINLLWVGVFGNGQGIGLFWLELVIVVHFWIAAMGMYLAARSLGLRKSSSLVSALIYALFGGLAMRSVQEAGTFYGLCYIPWVLYTYNEWLRSQQRRFIVLCGTLLGMIILAGHLQPWFHAILIVALFALLRSPLPSFEPWLKTALRRMAALGIVVGISALIALPQVLLSAQYLPRAYRYVGEPKPVAPTAKISFITFTKTFSYAPDQIFSIVDPVKFPVEDGNEVYVGLVGLGMLTTMLALFRRQLKEHAVWRSYRYFIIGGIGVGGIIMFGYWTFISDLLRVLPLVSQVRELARYSIVVHVCLALLLGICLDIVGEQLPLLLKNRRLRLWATALSAFVLLNAFYIYEAQKRGIFGMHFVYENIALAVTLGAVLLLTRYARWVLVAGIILSALAEPVWFLPLTATQLRYPPSFYARTPAVTYLERYYGQGRVMLMDEALPNNIGDVYRIQTINGYQATLQREMYQYWDSPDPAGKPDFHVELMNVMFVVSKQQHVELPLVLHDTVRDIYVYKRPAYEPRAYFASQIDACLQGSAACTPPRITQYSDHAITMRSASATRQRLVLAETMYPGWHAYIDGEAAKVTAYNPAGPPNIFRSTMVPAGVHTVEFRYQPWLP
ncbi:MAG TPA: hypothetical protein VLF71_00860 [Candidatus Saccharimonadales bacterium]|nr:hypothetical protein [Candidatus Saccharimonadales bacterium]